MGPRKVMLRDSHISCSVRGIITLGIQVYKYFFHWALKSVNITYFALFGSLGLGFGFSA